MFIVADSLIGVKPDSAVALLDGMADEMASASRSVRMYYQLLCIKAKDKAYIRHTSDGLILQVLDYYVLKNDKRHLPEAYYYAGRVYRDLGDAPQALDCLEKATDALGTREEYPLRSRICSQIGTLFMQQDLYEEAAESFRKAYCYDILLKDTAGMVFDLRDVAGIWRYMEQPDSALHYYRKAYDLASALQNRRLMDIVENQMASLYIELGQYDLAKSHLQSSLANLRRPSKSAVYSIASKLYHRAGNVDSACYYYKELLKCGTIYAKQAANRSLAEIALLRSEPEVAILYLQQYTHCADSIRRITDMETIRKMHSLYNYQLREKENIQLKAENERKERIMVYMLSVGFVLAALTVACLQYNRRRRLQLHVQLDNLHRLQEEQHRRSSQFIEENKKQMEELENRLQSMGHANDDLKIQLQRQKEVMLYTNKQAEIELNEREMKQTVFFSSDIYRFFKEQAQASACRVTDEDWNALECAVNDTYGEFIKNLQKLHSFSCHEIHICLLIKINIQPVDMAKLTNHTRESVSATRRRLYEKVFRKKGSPKQWDEFIYSL
ncbi:lipopolysaccharide assembly protein LapB [uncultured Bacteroides sp.]|nr:tetratricopeptide repeat protein [uncultured Bacteroides sp.]